MLLERKRKRWIWTLIPLLGLAVSVARASDVVPLEAPPPSKVGGLDPSQPLSDFVPVTAPAAPVPPGEIKDTPKAEVDPNAAAFPPPEKPVVPNQALDKIDGGKPNGGPEILSRPVVTPPEQPSAQPDYYGPSAPFQAHDFVPTGFTGPSSVIPTEQQVDGHFVPVEDRWRVGLPEWDRYGTNHPRLADSPYEVGRWYDPFRQNVLKGDYPMFGQNTFLELTGVIFTLFEPRQVPTQTGAFESTARPFQAEFFGRPNQRVAFGNVIGIVDLIHGDAGFKQADWRVRVGFISNFNGVGFEEVAQINPDVRKGLIRNRTFTSISETFVEKKIADLSPTFDFVSMRLGAQLFNSDFRGFVWNNVNLAGRIFGNYESNRDQFNLIYFDNIDVDTNSGLIGPYDRSQQVLIGNVYRQDVIWPGYQMLLNVHYNRDQPSFRQNRNSATVRPDIAGITRGSTLASVTNPSTSSLKGLNVGYLGWGGDGHINRFNVSHQFYVALGRDSKNAIGNGPQDVMAYMGALELSYDRDYVRFRSSYFFSSGDGNPNNNTATGFDTIIDNPNFAGTLFSYWQRQSIPLFAVGLKNRLSLVPSMRADKFQSQSNFVNPGLQLFNLGFDVDITPKIKSINNYNLLWFDKTAVLDQFLFQGNVDRFIGADLSTGLEYRPLLNENVVMLFGLATLIPGEGFRDLYNRYKNDVPAPVAAFGQLTLKY